MKIYGHLPTASKQCFRAILAYSILAASAGAACGQTPIIYTFNSSADTAKWVNAGQSVKVTSSFIAGDAPPGQTNSTGALGWTGTFDNTNRYFGELRLSFPSVDLTGYTDFQFDVKVVGPLDSNGQIQALQPTLGITASGNWNQSSVQPQLVNVTTNNGWQHISIPLTAFSDGSLSDVRQIFLNVDDENYTSATTMKLEFDNIEFTGPAPGQANAQVEPPASVGNVTITVGSQPRQTFEGLGASSLAAGGDYMQLSPGQRAKLNDMVWRDARFNTMRIWLHLKEYAPVPGQRNFEDEFPDNQATVVRDAQAAGVTHLLLGPYEIPQYLMERLPAKGRDGNGQAVEPYMKSDQFDGHAAIIADFIRDLWEKDHIAIEATGIQNEPNDPNDCVFTPRDVVRSVKALRAALDARGLRRVKIIAPESVGCNPPAIAQVDALKADQAAWNDIAGIASHDYDGGANERMADSIAGAGKDYWMTEFCVGGPEEPGDFFRASAEATAFLSDVNQRVNYWIHFIGYLSSDPKDNGTRLIADDANVAGNGWPKVFEQYYYLQQLGRTFDAGAVFRQSISSLDNEMTWLRDNKPRITVAVARNPDGSWGIGISDYTSDDFPHHFAYRGKPAQSFAVTVNVEELAKAGELRFEARRIGPQTKDSPPEPVTMSNGQLTVTINPLELVTLRSMSQ